MDLVAGVRKEGSRYVIFLILLYRPQFIDQLLATAAATATSNGLT